MLTPPPHPASPCCPGDNGTDCKDLWDVRCGREGGGRYSGLGLEKATELGLNCGCVIGPGPAAAASLPPSRCDDSSPSQFDTVESPLVLEGVDHSSLQDLRGHAHVGILDDPMEV